MKDNAFKIVAVVATAAALVLGAVLITQDDDDDSDDALISQTSSPSEAPTQEVPLDDANDTLESQQQTVEADDQPISNSEADKVAKAALDIAGGGTVTDLDRSDDPGEAWEIEITQGATEIDIALDENLDRVQNTSYDD